MPPRSGDLRNQALDELVGRESQCNGPVTPRPLQSQLQASIVETCEAVIRDWRAGEIPTHSLEAIPVVRRYSRGGLKIVTLDLGTQPPEHHGVGFARGASYSYDATATPREI